jgi:hypothetical protein
MKITLLLNIYMIVIVIHQNTKNTEILLHIWKNITYKFAIKKLIKYGLTIKCNHPFLEDIVKIKNTDNFLVLNKKMKKNIIQCK